MELMSLLITVNFPTDTLEHLVNFAVVNMAHVILFNLWQNHQCNCDFKNKKWHQPKVSSTHIHLEISK